MSSVMAVLSPSRPAAPVRAESRGNLIAPVRLQFPPACGLTAPVYDASRTSPVPDQDLSLENVENLITEFESAASKPNLTHRQFNHNFVNPLLRICKDGNAHDVLGEARVAERLMAFLTSEERHMMTAAAVMLSNMVATKFPLAPEMATNLRNALEDLKESRVKPEWERVFSTRETRDRDDHMTMA